MRVETIDFQEGRVKRRYATAILFSVILAGVGLTLWFVRRTHDVPAALGVTETINEMAARTQSPDGKDMGWFSERLKDTRILTDDLHLSAQAKALVGTLSPDSGQPRRVCDLARGILLSQGFSGLEEELAELWQMFSGRGWSSQGQWSPQDYHDAEPLLKAFARMSFEHATRDGVIPELQVCVVASEGWSIRIPQVAEAHRTTKITVILDYLDHRDPALMKLSGGKMVLELRPEDVMEFLQAVCDSRRPAAVRP